MSDALDSAPTHGVCPNCNAAKRGRFCAVCGQNDRNYQRSVYPVVADMLAETFEADSRLWRTIGVLFARPGFLSLEFSRNRRARYLSPFRLYLFTSIAFFFVLSFTVELPKPPPRDADADGPTIAQKERRERIRGALPTRFTVQIDEDRVQDDGDEQFVESADTDAAIAKLKEHLDSARAQKVDEIMLRRGSPFRVALAGAANALSGLDLDVAELDDLDRYLLNQGIDILHRPADAVNQFVEYLPVAMFFLLPIYALLLKLMYIRRRRFYSEHLVFGMHIHTVAFVAFTVAVVTPEVWFEWLDSVLWLGLFVYYFLALKRYYGDGVLATAVKFVILLWLYSALLTVQILATGAAVLLLF